MAEQWPFKPLVESSSLSTLTFYFDDPWLRAPSWGDSQASPRSLFVLMTLGCEPHRGWYPSLSTLTFCFDDPWLRAPSRGGIQASPRSLFVLMTLGCEPHRGVIRASLPLLAILLPRHQINPCQDQHASQQCRQCQRFVKQDPANNHSPHRFQQGNHAHHLGFQLLQGNKIRHAG